jgi:lysozyme family protein
MVDVSALILANAKQWASAKLTSDFNPAARALVDARAKARYQVVEAKTGVPWAFVAVVHQREASQRWDTQLGQGDPLGRISVHVPVGRGPFSTWEDAAIDALTRCAPYPARNNDWSIGRTLTELEKYNGLAYAARGRPSPYIWSGTDQYRSGKYVRDGVYDPEAIDSQLGCAGLLQTMIALDHTITFAGSRLTPISSAPASTNKSLPPSITNPASGSIGAFVCSLIAAIFKRK